MIYGLIGTILILIAVSLYGILFESASMIEYLPVMIAIIGGLVYGIFIEGHYKKK